MRTVVTNVKQRIFALCLSARNGSSRRSHSTGTRNAQLNVPIDYSTHPLLNKSSSYAQPESPYPLNAPSTRQNLFQAINSALRHALQTDERTLLFGEDVAFGGVFRCSMDLARDFGSERVFNTPLSEQGIAGFAIGCAAQGMKPIAEIQFADYVFPAFDQLVNEAAKWRFREGDTGGNIGGLVVRMPCGVVGHGALYHSQSPEVLFTHIPGLRVVIPRSPAQAKGLLLASFACNDPVIFLEPKMLYRAAVEQVPNEAYELPLSKAEVVKSGRDVSIVSYGQPLYLCSSAIAAAEMKLGVSVELIDLRTIYPWDRETVLQSVQKTGRAIVVHESMTNAGVGAEVAATIQEGAFLNLEAPVQRVAGWATHMGLVFERFNVPDVTSMFLRADPLSIIADFSKGSIMQLNRQQNTKIRPFAITDFFDTYQYKMAERSQPEIRLVDGSKQSMERAIRDTGAHRPFVPSIESSVLAFGEAGFLDATNAHWHTKTEGRSTESNRPAEFIWPIVHIEFELLG